jgi:EpsI family protein
VKRARLILILLFLLLPVTTGALSLTVGRGSLGLDLDSLPPTLSGYTRVGAETLEPAILDMLQPDAYVMQRYVGVQRRPVSVYMASYSGGTSTGAHDPSVCYPAQGWDLRELHEHAVDLGSEGSMVARLLVATQLGDEELVLYWFQPVARWPHGAPLEYLLRVRDRMLGRPQYVFVRLSTPLGGDRAGAQAALEEIARSSAIWLRDAIADERATLRSARN